jgi:hypothetical protein
MAVPIKVPVAGELITSAWGKSVADELNTRSVKVDGTPPIVGTLTITGSPGIQLRRTGDAPFLEFENTTGATRFGYIQGQSTQMIYQADSNAAVHRFLVGTPAVEHLRVDSGGVDVTGTLTATGKLTLSAGLDVNVGPLRVGGNGGQIQLIDTSTAGNDFHDAYLSFYGAGVSMVSPGTRTGYIGFPGSTTLTITNEVANGGVRIAANGTGTLALATGSSGDITLTTGAAGNIILNSNTGVTVLTYNGQERGRAMASFMWGKSVGGSTNPGVELFESGTIYSTTATNAVPNMLLRHKTDADETAFIQFANAAGGILSEINQDAAAPVGIHITNGRITAPSDYRLKDDLGPIVGALDRVMRLLPKHLRWKESGRAFDGFIAHELADVVPDAVFGERDAVYAEAEAARLGVEVGSIKGQSVDLLPVIPLLAAAVQELAERLDAVEDAA